VSPASHPHDMAIEFAREETRRLPLKSSLLAAFAESRPTASRGRPEEKKCDVIGRPSARGATIENS